MPYDAPAAKMQATRDYGAEIVNYDRYNSKITGEELAQKLAKERGMVYLPSYNHEHVIAGQGTAEISHICIFSTGSSPPNFLLYCGAGSHDVCGKRALSIGALQS